VRTAGTWRSYGRPALRLGATTGRAATGSRRRLSARQRSGITGAARLAAGARVGLTLEGGEAGCGTTARDQRREAPVPHPN